MTKKTDLEVQEEYRDVCSRIDHVKPDSAWKQTEAIGLLHKLIKLQDRHPDVLDDLMTERYGLQVFEG